MGTECIPPSTAVDCGALTNPVNGQVSHTGGTTLGQTATYRCNADYNLVGSSTRTCQPTRVWSGSAPTCQRMLLFNLEHEAAKVCLHDLLGLGTTAQNYCWT